MSISHSNYITPACKPGLHRVLLMLGRVNVGGYWLWTTYTVGYLCPSLQLYSCPRETQSTDPLDVGLEPHTTMHMTLRASSASYGRHCKIGAATKIAPVKCTIPESVFLKSLH